MKLTPIIPGKLYQRGAFSHLGAMEKLATVKEHNVKAIISMWGPPDLALLTATWWIGLPSPDGRRVDAQQLLDVAEVVEPMMNLGSVITQCHAGRNRSGLMSALLVRQHLKLTGAEALDHVRTARPGAIANMAFEEFLKSLQAP